MCICHFYLISVFVKCVVLALDLFLVVLILQLIATVCKSFWIKASAK